MDNLTPSLHKAGAVNIKRLTLITSRNVVIDLNEFLSELNLYEDLFKSYMYGDLLISDSRNLIELLPIIGEELLYLEFFTPGFENNKHVIKKTFRIYKTSGRQLVRDTNTQSYILHFVSIEQTLDILLPLFRSFSGKITDIVEEIYFDYVSTNRNYKISEISKQIQIGEELTPLVILNDTSNSIKFVSPGWSPFKCINWLASKSIPKNETSKNFIFFETNKSFYFGSMEYLFKDAIENNNFIGIYNYAPDSLVREGDSRNVAAEFFTADEATMITTNDHIKNYTNGYLANRLIALDVYRKKYDFYDYDYVEDYKKQFHTSGKGETSEPVFTSDTPRNFSSSISFYPVNPRLFQNSESDYFRDNVSEKMGEIYGNRKSSLLGLTNLVMNITVPGRTDVEVGHLLYFKYPSLGPKSEEDRTRDKIDKQYSGFYLITAIHHRLTSVDYRMVMQITKDSLTVDI